MQIQLTSGFVVTFRTSYTHGMECAFKEALLKGMQLKQVGDEVVVEDIKADALDRAVEAVLALAIATISKDGQDTEYTRDWLLALPEKDFGLLKDQVDSLRENSESEKEKGKKNH